jgi:hypothetical protein
MPQEIGLFANTPLSLSSLLLNLAIGAVLALVLRWHFRRFGSTLSNRGEFDQVFPFVLLTTVLIITVVKSSLALSLGLVGALSIVRFRTPIKEPEELAYLFVAIAIGLGLGAAQTVPTVIAGLSILAVMSALKWTKRENESKNLYLSVHAPSTGETNPDGYLVSLNEAISKHVVGSDLRRFDFQDGLVEATYRIDVDSPEAVSALTDELRERFPAVGVTFLDQNRMPSV